MATNNLEPQKLTPSEVTRIFSKMSPLKATLYYNKCMTNPNTPKDNVDLIMQYRKQNENRFVSDDELKSSKNKGSWFKGKGYDGGYREKQYGRTYDDYGDSYDNRGKRYDRYGNEYGGFRDGGREPDYRVAERGGFSNYYGAGKKVRDTFFRKPIGEARSYEEVDRTVSNLKSNSARVKYFDKVVSNKESNSETIKNLIAFRDRNPDLFKKSEEDSPRRGGNYEGRGFWASLWKPKEEFDSMSPRKKQFFVGAYKRRDRAKNTAYSLRVMVNPTTPDSDKRTMAEVVNENPRLFFSKDRPSGGKRRDE